MLYGLSDFHNLIITVFKTSIPKSKQRVIQYRNYKNFDADVFKNELKTKLEDVSVVDYGFFETAFLDVLNKHAPCKKKTVRANDKPFMSKKLIKAIMKRSLLKKDTTSIKVLTLLQNIKNIKIIQID